MQGFVQVYTGDGKGKTTAAMGTALRAVGEVVGEEAAPVHLGEDARVPPPLARRVAAVFDPVLIMLETLGAALIEAEPAQAKQTNEGQRANKNKDG